MTSWADRLAAVRADLGSLLDAGGQTPPDPQTGERWDAGQVWAHVAEFPAYWVAQLRGVLAAPGSAFGRTKADPARLAAIDANRAADPAALWASTQPALDDLAALLAGPLDPAVTGVHSTLGPLDLDAILEHFLVGHLEEHAAQLRALAP